MTEKWPTADILRFLDIYEKYDVLWNSESPHYRDRSAREMALASIITEMDMDNLTVDIVRIKIKMIKTVYNQEKNKIIKSKKLGQHYKPRLVWFQKADSFLRDLPAKPLPNIKKEDEMEDSVHEPVQEDSMHDPEELTEEEEEEIPEPPPQKTKTILRKRPVAKLTGRIMKPDISKRNIETGLLNKIRHMTDAKVENEDEFYHFAKLIASQLRQLPIVNALHCQEQIMSVITQERLNVLQASDMEASSSQTHWTLNDT